jgi:cyclopropane fatty-acyl-phospholipid synthase-like methyltransferase
MSILYSGKIRDGKPGTLTNESYDVIYDNNKKYAYLSPFPVIEYSSDWYRKTVDKSELPHDFFLEHDYQQVGYFPFISSHLQRGMKVVDCGCGAGSMLDLISGVAGSTVAVEPFIGYHSSLEQRGHQVFNSLESAKEVHEGSADLALSIHVIEHTYDPLDYLKQIFALLKPGGKLVLFTPNVDDILLKLAPDVYAPFFYRRVHNYYFSGDSLEMLGIEAGFSQAKKFYYQEFTLGNTFNWLKLGEATRNGEFSCISSEMDKNWMAFLEASGQSYNVGVVLQK